MPIPLTLPLHFDLRLRVRRRRVLRVVVATLALLGAALLAAGFWLPAKAELGTAAHALAIGDTFTLERPDGVVRTYEVIALDVVDSTRVELAIDGDERLVSLVTPWPPDAVAVGGRWHRVVTGRLRF
jgi:hypothetical protein